MEGRDVKNKSRSFAKERNIETSLASKGYIEHFPVFGFERKHELWFFGELD